MLLILGAACAGGLLLIHRSLAAARAVWLVGVGLTILAAVLLFPDLPVAWMFSLLPLLVLLASLNLLAAVFSGLLVGLLLASLTFLSVYMGLPQREILLLLLVSLVGLAAAWSFSRMMVNIADWAMTNYRRSREELEDLRAQRVEWQQVKEDYDLVTGELARLTTRLEGMTQIAEEARRVKEEFVANVSHELRTPLNMILGFSEVIMNTPQAYGDCIPPALMADIAAIERNSQHLSRLVDDVLDLSQIEAGRMALMKEWVNVPEIVEQAVSAVRFLYETKKLYLRQELAQDLPLVFCDGTRVRQVLINLLSNAGRFTEKGGVEVRVWIEEERLVMAVADTGPGIARADQDKIFEPFRQLQSTLRGHKGGSGLGLSISKQFVEMHGGKMWLESQVGKGTTFFFNIHLKASPQEEGGAQGRRWFNPYYQYEPRARQSKVSPPDIKPRYVLLEETDTLQKYLRRYMQDVEIVSVKSIADAITELHRSPAQALIHNLPVAHWEPMDSFLGRLPFGTPLITCWVPGREETVQKLGVVDYLVKPVSRESLMDAIGKVNAGSVERVLLVDDEPEIIQLYSRILATELPATRVLQAMNGQRALHLMRERTPNVVLLDLMMPGKDGFQVLMEKGQDEAIRDIPVIVVSSRNPSGETIVSDTLSVARGSGLSLRELIEFIEDTSRIFDSRKATCRSSTSRNASRVKGFFK